MSIRAEALAAMEAIRRGSIKPELAAVDALEAAVSRCDGKAMMDALDRIDPLLEPCDECGATGIAKCCECGAASGSMCSTCVGTGQMQVARVWKVPR